MSLATLLRCFSISFRWGIGWMILIFPFPVDFLLPARVHVWILSPLLAVFDVLHLVFVPNEHPRSFALSFVFFRLFWTVSVGRCHLVHHNGRHCQRMFVYLDWCHSWQLRDLINCRSGLTRIFHLRQICWVCRWESTRRRIILSRKTALWESDARFCHIVTSIFCHVDSQQHLPFFSGVSVLGK